MSGAGAATVSVTATAVALTKWEWAGSGTLMPVSGSTKATADSIYNRTVGLKLVAFDADGKYSGVGGLKWGTPTEVEVVGTGMQPSGCFVCSTPGSGTACAAQVTNTDTVTVSGYFTTEGTCTLTTSAIKGLPTSTEGSTVSPSKDLEVTVGAPFGIETVPQTVMGAEMSNFTGLTGRTESGERAAVTGKGARLQVRVVDVAGKTVVGDYHTMFTLEPGRVGNATGSNATIIGSLTATAKGGVATFDLDSIPTRRAGCSGQGGEACPHAPWEFTVTAVSPMAPGTGKELNPMDTLTHVGPLHFVRQAERLGVRAKLGSWWSRVEPVGAT
eukprot:Sspe_Gene.1607::Locus_532_Transcript_2_2_Confidence_0.667_Length_2044::g.1607::m.1607